MDNEPDAVAVGSVPTVATSGDKTPPGDSGSAGSGGGGKSGNGGGIPDVAVRIGATILTGIGVVGLAAVVGGVILTMRFEAARLPTEWAISVVPRTELITLGAEVLIPLTFTLLLAFLLLRAAVANERAGRTIREHRWLQPLIGTAFILPAVLIYYFVASHHVAVDGRLALVVGIVLGGILVCALVAMPKPDDHDWGWFALTVLLVIAGVATGISWVRTYGTPQVRAAAVIRSGHDSGIAGLFVAQTSDHVYLARVDDTASAARGDGGTGRLISIPMDQVSEVEVGQNRTLPEALAEAPKLLSELKLCESPASDCEGDLDKLQPGFDGGGAAPLSLATVEFASPRKLKLRLRNTTSFNVSVVKVAVVGTTSVRNRAHHDPSVVFGPDRKTAEIGTSRSLVVTLRAPASGVALTKHPSRTQLRITVELEAPNGTHTTVHMTRHAVRRVDFV